MPLHLWLCKKNLYGKDFRKTSESVWRFESVHGFASVGNLYQKMHFAGSNLSTDRKTAPRTSLRCKNASKNSEKLQKRKKHLDEPRCRRNLPKSPFFGPAARRRAVFVPASKSDTQHGTSFITDFTVV